MSALLARFHSRQYVFRTVALSGDLGDKYALRSAAPQFTRRRQRDVLMHPDPRLLPRLVELSTLQSTTSAKNKGKSATGVEPAS
jgi:hypothetical protein